MAALSRSTRRSLFRGIAGLAWMAAAWVGAAYGEQGRPIIGNFGPKETGGGGFHWCTVQDERGVLYFGCDVVLSFDGEHWRTHRVPGANEVRGLAVGTGGRIWVGAVNEVGYFDRQATGELGAYHSLVPLLPPSTPELGDVWHVFARENGAVFVTVDSVLVWDGKTMRILPMKGARRIVASQVEDRIFLSHLALGIWSLNEDRLEPFIPPTTMNGAGVEWLEKTETGWLVVTTAGLARFESDQLIPFGAAASDFIRKNILTSACRLPGGDLCIGTLNGGICIVDRAGRVKRILTSREGLQSTAVFSLFVAQDGLLWVASPSGLSRISIDQGVSLYNGADGLAGRPYKNIAQAGQRIVVATAEGIFELPLQDDGAAAFEPVAGLAGSSHDLAGDDRELYVGRYKGVYRLRDNQVTRVFNTEFDVVRIQPSLAPPGGFVLANNYDLVRLVPDDHGGFSASTLARLAEGASTFAEDGAGNIWAGTPARGVFRVPDAPGSRPVAYHPAGAGRHGGRGLVSRVQDTIVIATAAEVDVHAIASAQSATIPNTPRTDSLVISNEDSAGHVWLAFDSPFLDGIRLPVIGRVTVKQDHRGSWEAYAVQGLNQLGGIRSLFVDNRGILWLGGDDAVLRLDPGRLQPIAAPHAPLIQASMAKGAHLRFHQSAASFDFAATEFGRRESVRFQTRLSDAADVWSPPTNSSHFTLAGLRDGDYTFAVRVINDVGLTGPESTWHFTVLPPWYRTKLAYTGWSLLALAGFFGIVHWRSAYLHRQNVRLEALVQKKTEQLEKANAAKSEFLANMSHEIRNPISGIVGLSLAMEETALDQRQKTLTDSIRSCASLLATLVDDVLDFSKIEAGKIDLRLAPFALRTALAQCIDMVKEELRVAGGRVELEIAGNVPELLVGDSARIQQIVLNFLTNAVKFGAGKTVTLGATAVPRGRVRLFVRDQGPGMSAVEAASLFTKFTRLERAHADNIRGSGLGLAVCRLLATKMGGTVGVESRLGEGACFWAELPLASTGAQPKPTPALAAAETTPLRALIVEDIAYNATAMQAVLRKLGIAAEVAADGPTALERLQASFYDVVFMDWNLPGMIGTEVVARYRAVEPANRRTIIIATTAYSAEFNREACLQAGMDAFIAKPFTPEKISAALQDLRGSLRAAASVEVRSLRDHPSPLAGIDLELLQLLADESPEGLPGQIDRYLVTFDADRRALAAAIPTGEAKEIHRLAHRLASHASMIKFEPLGQLAAEIQAHAATREADRLPRLFADFDREFIRLRDRLDALRTSVPPA